MLTALRRVARAGILLRELRGMRQEIVGLHHAIAALAQALTTHTRLAYPPLDQRPPTEGPVVEIGFVDDAVTAEYLDIERRLTVARGMPPTEEEVLEEYERRQAPAADPGVH